MTVTWLRKQYILTKKLNQSHKKKLKDNSSKFPEYFI